MLAFCSPFELLNNCAANCANGGVWSERIASANPPATVDDGAAVVT